MRPRPSLAAFALVAAALGVAAPAYACSLEPCTAPVRLFGRDATVPGNLVYFQLLGGVNVDGALQPLSPLKLETADGEPIAASVQTIGGDRVFAPDQTIPPGTRVLLKYRPTCRTADLPGEREYAFTTGQPFTEVLLTGPALEVTEEGEGDGGEVSVKLRYAYDRSVGARELAHLVEWAPTIDGVKAPLDEDAFSVSVTTLCSDRDEKISDGCGVLAYVPEGEHSVLAKGKVIGVGDLPEVQASVETRCAAADTDADEEDEDATPAPAVKAASNDGCSLAAGPDRGAPYLLVLLGLLMNGARTRRRRGA